MKTKYIILILITVLAFTSCKKYLDVPPTDFAAPEFAYDTENGMDKALTGVYSSLRKNTLFGRNLVFDLALGTDEAFYKRAALQVDPIVYNNNGTDPTVTNTWAALYAGINSANQLLANIDRPIMVDSARNVLKGQALFLRAFLYFQLVHHWGDVPLLLTPTKDSFDVNHARTPQKEVYEKILADMITAEGLVADIEKYGHSGRVTKSAVQGVLARVCLKMAGAPLKDLTKFEDARMWSEKVINSKKHSLNPNYALIFFMLSQDMYDIRESIWEVEIAGNGIANPINPGAAFAKKFSVRNTSGPLYGYAEAGATAILYRRYTDSDPHDVRRDRNIATYYFPVITSASLADTLAHPATDIYARDTGKWRIQEESSNSRNPDAGPANFPLLRYADVLLMYAEAENEVNGPTTLAFDALNLVRARAKARNFTPADAADKGAFRALIQDERSRELCYEATRKFDLIRWGIFIDVMKDVEGDILSNAPSSLQYGATGYTNVSTRNLLLPIPTLELNVNNLMRQNPGF